MNARLNLLALAAGSMILALIHGDPTLVLVAVVFAIITSLFVIALPPPRLGTPRTITRLPTEHERRRGGSRWLYGLFVRIPLIPFLSVGLFRWRGRK